jgi:hypothetical protein
MKLFYLLGAAILQFTFGVNGAALPRSNLVARGYQANSITGYTTDSHCSGPNHYTWQDVSYNQCYEYKEGGFLVTIKVTHFSEGIVVR